MPHADDAAVGHGTDRSELIEKAARGGRVQNHERDSPGTFPEKSVAAGMVLDTLDIARFWSRVEVRGRSHCWPWRYGLSEFGYGEYRSERWRDSAHRVAYRIARGMIAAGCVVRHTCDNPACCNPAHLELGSHADNVADRVTRHRSARGEGNGRARLKEADVKCIKASPLSIAYFARLYGVDQRTIAAIRSGRTWQHVTDD